MLHAALTGAAQFCYHLGLDDVRGDASNDRALAGHAEANTGFHAPVSAACDICRSLCDKGWVGALPPSPLKANLFLRSKSGHGMADRTSRRFESVTCLV